MSEFGRPISGDVYIAMDDGTVLSNIYDIFKAVRGDGYFKDVEGKFSTIFKVADWDLIVPLEEPNLRIDYAVKKLKTDRMFRRYSIQGISQEAGFNSRESFNRAFKGKTGILPSYFIEELKKIN